MWKPIPMRTNTNERCGLAYTQSRFGVGFANSISHIKKALEHPRADAEKRRVFQKKIEEHKKDGRPIVYIHESGFAHDMPRTHGYAVKGKRCFGTHDWQARGRINVIGALLGTALVTVRSLYRQYQQRCIPWLARGCPDPKASARVCIGYG